MVKMTKEKTIPGNSLVSIGLAFFVRRSMIWLAVESFPVAIPIVEEGI